jgi:hypothetical protein
MQRMWLWLTLVLLHGAACAHHAPATSHHGGWLALSAPVGSVQAMVPGAMAAPHVLAVIPSVTESTRARILVLLGQGNLRAAIEAWEVHTGRMAPRAAWGMQAAFQKANQVAGACIRVARSLHEGFKSLDLKPQLVRFSPPGRDPRLGWEMQPGVPHSTIQISDTGKHFAVKMGERIYDAFTGPAGMLMDDYLERLHAHGGKPVMQTLERLP